MKIYRNLTQKFQLFLHHFYYALGIYEKKNAKYFMHSQVNDFKFLMKIFHHEISHENYYLL